MAGMGASAGAALGNAFAPGVGGAVGGLFGSFLDGSSGASASPSAPLTASAAVYGSGLDSSGYSVNFAGMTSTGSNKPGAAGLVESIGLGGINPTYLLIGALLVGVLIWKKSRSK